MRYFCLGLALITSFAYGESSFYYIQGGKKMTLEPILNVERSISDKDYYKTKDSIVVGVDNTLLVKFKDIKNLEKYMKEFGVNKKEEVFSGLYKFTLEDKSQTLKVANELSKRGDIEYSHPNFFKQRISR